MKNAFRPFKKAPELSDTYQWMWHHLYYMTQKILHEKNLAAKANMSQTPLSFPP